MWRNSADRVELVQLQGLSYWESRRSLLLEKTYLFGFSMPLGDQEGRLDLSHPVHVDNCLLEPETNQCWREPPAFIHRDLRYGNDLISRENRAAKNINCVCNDV